MMLVIYDCMALIVLYLVFTCRFATQKAVHCLPSLQNMSMEDIPEDLITDCVQLVKANSIMGTLSR